MTTVGNVGIGLFILIILWILALIIFVIAVKTQSNLGWFALGIAAVVTIILTTIPTEHQETQKILSYDYSYVYRSVLLWFLITSVFIGSFSIFILHCIEPIRPKRIVIRG